VISLSTAYRWLKSGKITEDFRTLGQHRRFNEQDLVKQFIKPDSSNLLTVLYARVSSHDQKADLLTQEAKLLDFANKSQCTHIKLISDLGSGLNYKKKGLKQLLNLILTKQMKTLIVNHKDRLLRFGS
jgi:predicted site-specific integrase-resolvase